MAIESAKKAAKKTEARRSASVVERNSHSGKVQRTGPRRSRATPADDPLSSSRVRYLVDAFGGKALANFAGVSASQPTRWTAGDERPGPIAAPLLIDLEHVLAKARLVWGEDAAQRWLVSANAFLGGARPLDALRLKGPSMVLDALDGEMWGGAA